MSKLNLNEAVIKKNSIMCTTNTDGTLLNTTQGKDFNNVWLILNL